jgi:hypothetical protein
MSKEKKVREPKSEKKRIITFKRVIIVLLIAACVAALSFISIKFIIPKAKQALDIEPETNYTYVKYGKGKLPSELADMLKAAGTAEKSACDKYGTALTIGNRSISYPTMVMAYIDAYNREFLPAYENYSNYGYFPDNFPIQMYPEYVDYSDDTTWSEYLINEASNYLAQHFYLFDKALEEGYMADDSTIENIINQYESLNDYASGYDNGVQGLLEANYAEGVTYESYAGYLIMQLFAESYSESVKDDLSEEITESEIEDHIEGNEINYQVFCGYIYPITGGSEGYDKVTTKDEFFSFAIKDQGDEDYDAENGTLAYYTSYETVSKAYGDIVADYVFSADRKAGEIGYVDNGKYVFLVCVDEPTHFETSVSCVFYYQFYSSTDEDTMATEKEEYTKTYDEWVAAGATKDGLISICDSNPTTYDSFPYGETNMRVNTFHVDVDKWLRDPSRKEGDYKIFYLENNVAIAYFEKSNPDDYDYFETGKEEIAEEKFDEEYSCEGNELYTTTLNEDMLSDIYSDAHDPINNLVGVVLGTNTSSTATAEATAE